ncbi:DNA/RNA nuclease SfsA [Geobacter sp. DSM 9736]|uniref:DNA/RNA nuclease SfsA n=1 Tax=Geobacter sp. DSM 9736 TaxID=1277350 RepID=UPI000B507B5B|nr:DNA/RNA nuclease SfsA [Geobacter sp. DSM 9736]SNB47264.1 sugar fermentation stimulation protein A [Geobacter sp. DSM 9736]
MKFPPLLEGTLVKRYKRFLADVVLPSGETVTVHCPNSGSMLRCSSPGTTVYLSDSCSPTRKCRYTWELLQDGSTFVCVNTSRTNRVVAEALHEGAIPSLSGYQIIRPEYPYGESRLDFFLSGGKGDCLLEVKSVTLAEGCRATFPDAVTERGRRHLTELRRGVAEGKRGVILFVIQRTDCDSFSPADSIDPKYGAALREVVSAGVEALAFRTTITTEEIRLAEPVPVVL